MPYATGEEPKVGDVVESRHSKKGHDEIIEGEVYKVISVHDDRREVLLRGHEYGWDAERFNLLAR